MFVATVGLKADTQSNEWIVDSGASRHMTFESTILHDSRILKLQNQLDLVMVVLCLLLELVRSRSLHIYTMVEVLLIDLWHQRLVHVNLKQLHQLVECLDGIDIQSESKLSFCETCVQGKCHQLWANANTILWWKLLFYHIKFY